MRKTLLLLCLLAGRRDVLRPGELSPAWTCPRRTGSCSPRLRRPAEREPSTRCSSPMRGPARMRQLTFYPEEVQLLQDRDVLQIQNRFGVFRSEQEFRNLAPIAMFPSFVAGRQVQSGTIAPMQTSPDGRYLLYLRTRSPAYGDLTLLNVATGAQTVVSAEGRALPGEPAGARGLPIPASSCTRRPPSSTTSPLRSCRTTACCRKTCGTSAPAPWRTSAGPAAGPCTTSRGSSSTPSIRTSCSRARCTPGS